MSIVLNGTTGVTTPDVTSDGSLKIDASAPDDSLVVDASGNVGIGTSSLVANRMLTISGANGVSSIALVRDNNSVASGTIDAIGSDGLVDASIAIGASINGITFSTGGGGATERARIDSSGDLLVGKTSAGIANNGFEARADGLTQITRAGGIVASLNRKTSDGAILEFNKDGTAVGSISIFAFSGQNPEIVLGSGNTGLKLNDSIDAIHPFNSITGGNRDNVVDLGTSTNRFDDVYATNGTIQTSDRNEKQDIETLSEAEARVAVACKGLLRKFRWKDKVAEKGDEARIHFGIIAQDLQDAFAAEGLDAGRYAMFISSTWWEAERIVPAVEEVLDDEGNVVTEAVAEYTVVDSYSSAEEAPEGATERTRLGVRYPELLAFIIGAI